MGIVSYHLTEGDSTMQSLGLKLGQKVGQRPKLAMMSYPEITVPMTYAPIMACTETLSCAQSYPICQICSQMVASRLTKTLIMPPPMRTVK